MSRSRSYRITCDGPVVRAPTGGYATSCDQGHDGMAAEIEMCETRTEAEQQARTEGWTIGKYDRCPGCQP